MILIALSVSLELGGTRGRKWESGMLGCHGEFTVEVNRHATSLPYVHPFFLCSLPPLS
jgi:hypothetical protein